MRGRGVVDAGKHASAPLVENLELGAGLVQVRLEGDEGGFGVNLGVPVVGWCRRLLFRVGKVVVEMDLLFDPCI